MHLTLQATRDAVERALDQPVTPFEPDGDWHAWWASRAMLGAAMFEAPTLPAGSAQTVLQELIDHPDRSGFFASHRDSAVEMGAPLCTENFDHLAALAALFDHIARASRATAGALVVFDANWGSDEVMLFARIDEGGLHPTTATTLADVDTDVAAVAQERIGQRLDELSARFAD